MAKRAARPKGAAAELTLTAGAAPKRRKQRKHEWSRRKEEAFLTELAETCNVTLAAEAAGISATAAYNRRKTHAAFRAGWAEAMATAYQQLELVLLDRAIATLREARLLIDGQQVIGSQLTPIADPAGGTKVDAEARTQWRSFYRHCVISD